VNTGLKEFEYKIISHCIHSEYKSVIYAWTQIGSALYSLWILLCISVTWSISIATTPSIPYSIPFLSPPLHPLHQRCLSLPLLPLRISLSLHLLCYQPTITSIAPWDFLILLLISFKGPRSMLHGHHTWHRGGPFHGSACSTQFLSQMFCVPGPPRNFPISKARHALSRWFAYKERPDLTEGQKLGTRRQQAVESKNAAYF